MEPLLFHHHIPKTGGQSIRELVRANYPAGERVHLEREGARVPAVLMQERDPWESVRAQWRDYYESLTPERRAAIRCVDGHQVPFMMAAVNDRPVRAFCLLRDPVDRVISIYRWMVWRAEVTGSVDAPNVVILREMRRRGWSVKDVYRELGDTQRPSAEVQSVFGAFFNSQARVLLSGTMRSTEIPFVAGTDGLGEVRDRALRLLSDTYVVGTQDRFSQSVRLFADSFGWRRVYLPQVNVNPHRRSGDAEIDEETRALISRHNAVDAELHARHSQALQDAPSTGRLTNAYGNARRRTSALRSRLRGG